MLAAARGASLAGGVAAARRAGRPTRHPRAPATRRSPSPPTQPWTATFAVDGRPRRRRRRRPPTTTTTTTTDATEPATDGGTAARAASTHACASSPTARSTTAPSCADVLDGDLPTAVGQRRPSRSTLGDGSTLADRRPDDHRPRRRRRARRCAGRACYPVTVELARRRRASSPSTTRSSSGCPSTTATGAPMNVAIVAAAPDPGPAPTADEVADGRERLSPIADAGGGGRRADHRAAAARPRSTASPATTRRSPRTLRDVARRRRGAGRCRPTCSTRRRPWRSTPRTTFARELRSGEDVLGRRPAASSAAARGVARRRRRSAPTPRRCSRDLGFRLLVLDAGRSTTELDGNIGGYHDTTLAFDVDLGDGGDAAGDGRRRRPAAARPGRRSSAATSAPTDAAVRDRGRAGDDAARARRRSCGAASSSRRRPARSPDADVAGAVARLRHEHARLPAGAAVGACRARPTRWIVGDDGPADGVACPPTPAPTSPSAPQRIDLTRVAAAAPARCSSTTPSSRRGRPSSTRCCRPASPTTRSTSRWTASPPRRRRSAPASRRPPPFTFTLTGRSSPLRLQPAQQRRRDRCRSSSSPSSPKLTFPEGDQLVDARTADGVTEVVIPVEARTQRHVGDRRSRCSRRRSSSRSSSRVVLTARVNALTGLGQVVTGGAILVLAARGGTATSGAAGAGGWALDRRGRAAADELGSTVSPDAAEVVAVGPTSSRPAQRLASPTREHRRPSASSPTAPATCPTTSPSGGASRSSRSASASATRSSIDREQLTTAEFWARCAASPELPSTAAPSPGRFEEAYRRLAERGAHGHRRRHRSPARCRRRCRAPSWPPAPSPTTASTCASSTAAPSRSASARSPSPAPSAAAAGDDLDAVEAARRATSSPAPGCSAPSTRSTT